MSMLLITPPMLQINTPYPATACLAGFLQARSFEKVAQVDLSLELALKIFSADGLRQADQAMRARRGLRRTPGIRHFLKNSLVFQETIEPVVRFLQGGDDALAWRIAGRAWLPEGARFQAVDFSLDAGAGGVHDAAKHLASLYLDDLADAIRDGVDARFGFARYADHLAVSAPRFDPLLRALEAKPTLLDRMLDDLTDAALATHAPKCVGLTVPFPGTLYGALRIARRIRRQRPRTRIVLGGGYVNTELRELDDPRVFDFVDFICFDDGEEPLLQIAEQMRDGRSDDANLVRTLVRRRGRVVRCGFEKPARCVSAVIPAYEALPLKSYISLAESTNPMHRLWSDGCWLKLPLAHGCYWHKCRFCDTALDYIGRYAPPRADDVVDRMVELQRRTGLSGFHFTDEALSPVLLRQVAERLLARGVACAWWGNIRFERAFTPELARLLARAGCVAVTGGLECAHDRLLALMEKGVTLRTAARTCKAFADAGIHVHTYLMYGFPTQTAQETVDGLEFSRQLFAAGFVQSAYWHRFALTCHSPLAQMADEFGIRIRPERVPVGKRFARNELAYDEPGAPDHDALGVGLRRAVYNYMLGLGLNEPLAAWFDCAVPETRLKGGPRYRMCRGSGRPDQN